MDIASLCQTADVHPHFKMQPSPVSSRPSPPLSRQSTSEQLQGPPRLPTPATPMGISSLLNAAPTVRRSSHSSHPDSPDRKSDSNESRSTSASYAETVLTQYLESTSPSTKRKASEDPIPSVAPAKKKSRTQDSKVPQDINIFQKKKSQPSKDMPPRLPKPIWAQSWRQHVQARDGHPHPQAQPQPQPQSHPQTRQQAEPVAEFEPNIWNVTPGDIIVNKISDFIYIHIMNKDASQIQTAYHGVALEIEAKLGHIIDRTTSQRLELPVATETVIDASRHPDLRLAFESSMTELQHRHLNKKLNEAVQASLTKGPTESSPMPLKPRSSIAYKHTREVDTFCGLTPEGTSKLPPFMRDRRNSPKVRITRLQDGKDDKILAKIIKSRVADFDIFCPESPVDCRISINYEMQYEGSMEDILPPETGANERAARNKDRMSYKHQACQIDLTQVTIKNSQPQATRKEHELEIELAVDTARQQAALLLAGKPSSYHSMITAFYNNVRTLGRELKNAPTKQPATPTK